MVCVEQASASVHIIAKFVYFYTKLKVLQVLLVLDLPFGTKIIGKF